MSRTIPAIEPTAAQWKIVDSLSDPYIKAASDGVLKVYEVKDDNHVALYTIEPDGDYIVEMLLNGFNQGWTTLDFEGYEVERDEHSGELMRISDEPISDW